MHIVLVNGWSASARLWKEFVALLPIGTQFEVIDLDKSLSVDQWMTKIDAKVKDNTVLMGWSLGGELAIRYAARTDKVLGAVCLFQTNPCFVQKEDWLDAMPVDQFLQFLDVVNTAELKLIKRQFAYMMVEGSRHFKTDRRLLKHAYEGEKVISSESLMTGMALLQSLDVRDDLNDITCPMLSVLGGKDALVPVGLAEHVESKIIPDMGHLPCLSHVQAVFDLVQEFLRIHV